MQTERILAEVVTVANMAGVAEAQAGFLKLNVATAALAIGLAIAVKVGKDAIDNYKSQSEAMGQLAQAVGVYNEHLGRNKAATTEYIAGTRASKRETNALRDAQDRIKLATNAVTVAEINLNQAMTAKHINAARVEKAQIALADAQIRLTEVERHAGSVTLGTAGHYVTLAATHRKAAISLEEYRQRVEAFIHTNAAYVKNQYDVIKAAADLVRAGNTEKNALRELNVALDMSVVKNEDVSTAALAVEKVLMGNSKALREVGVSSAAYNKIMKSHHDQAWKLNALLTIMEQKYKGVRTSVDEVDQSHNKLTIAWQDFTTRLGPTMATILTAITDETLFLVDAMSKLYDWLGKLQGPDMGAGVPGTRGYRPPPPAGGGMGQIGRVHGSGGPGGIVYGARAPVVININGGAFMDHGPTIDALANAITRRLAGAPGI